MVQFSKEVEGHVDNLVIKLKRRQVAGANDVTVEVMQKTAKLLRNIIAGSRWNDIGSLTELVQEAQRRLIVAMPIELSSDNTARRILHIIYEEDLELQEGEKLGAEDYSMSWRDMMKNFVLMGISEIIDEVESANTHIASYALEHIHSDEIILIMGYSQIVLQFLKEASRLRKFQVVVAENAPFFDGHKMAIEIAKFAIETTVITDSAVFALMSRVNKVILSAHAVTADGGLVAISGSHMVASAAKHHSTPVLVCATLHSLTSQYLVNDADYIKLCVSPETVHNFADLEHCRDAILPNPFYDYVGPDLLSLLITDFGPHPPSNLARVFEYCDRYED